MWWDRPTAMDVGVDQGSECHRAFDAWIECHAQFAKEREIGTKARRCNHFVDGTNALLFTYNADSLMSLGEFLDRDTCDEVNVSTPYGVLNAPAQLPTSG